MKFDEKFKTIMENISIPESDLNIENLKFTLLNAVREGKKVYWKNENYFIVFKRNDFWIKNNFNDSMLGLMDVDGKWNFNPLDFVIE